MLLEPMLRTAAEQRDRLVIATALAAPASTFPLISEPLADELRETMAGAADPENRRVLKRLRELIDAADRTIREFRAQLAKDAPGLVPDLLQQMAGRQDGAAQPDQDPIATMAAGKGKVSEAPVA